MQNGSLCLFKLTVSLDSVCPCIFLIPDFYIGVYCKFKVGDNTLTAALKWLQFN